MGAEIASEKEPNRSIRDLGERLHVALGYCAKQDQLEQFIVADGIGAGFEQPLPQALAMAVVVRRRCRQ